MAKDDFTGMRKVTIRYGDGENDFVVFGADKISADGFTAALENNEVTVSSYAGDVTSVSGTNVSTATLTLIPKNIADFGDIWPEGWDATTESWQPIIGGCSSSDVTLAFEKVCDTKGNIVLRHAQIGSGAEFGHTRDDALTLEITVYPQLSEGSEYGLAGDFADKLIPFQYFDGLYDPSTDTVAFDSDES